MINLAASMMLFVRLSEAKHLNIGLLLKVLSPAAAWYVVLNVCHFLPSRGQKMTHKRLNTTDKRKSCLYYVVASTRQAWRACSPPKSFIFPELRWPCRRSSGEGSDLGGHRYP